MSDVVDGRETVVPSLLLISEEEAKRSIVVSNIPPKTSAEIVHIHFQRKKHGGGEIDRVHISEEGTAVITFEGNEVMTTVLQESHTLEGSSSPLKIHRFVPDHPLEVFQRAEARINLKKFSASFEKTRNIPKVLKDKAKVECVSIPNSNQRVLSGTFDQIVTAHDFLQGLLKGGFEEGKERDSLHAGGKKNSSETPDEEASDSFTTDDFNSLEVQPQFMRLLHRVYNTKLRAIEDEYGVKIRWRENDSQVQIHRVTNDNESYQKGSDAFINLYQGLYPKMQREEIESNARELLSKDICSMEDENNVVIEVNENKVVVYAEDKNMSVAMQALKETLGLLPGSRKGTRRGQRNTRNSNSSQNRPSARELCQDLMNGVKLSLYQSDITNESVDAIVNAANEWLQHGGGVAAAIVRKGGRQIQEESRRIIAQRSGRELSVGDAVYTKAGTLPCSFVIHTVGPRWDSFDKRQCISLLHRACIKSLCLAAELELCSIALPPISSGIFGMSKDVCAQVMFGALEDFSSSVEAEFSTLRDIRIVIIDDETIDVFHEEFLKRYTSQVKTETNAVGNDEEPHSSSNVGSNVNKLPLPSEERSEDSHDGHFKETELAKFPQGDQSSMGSDNPPGQISKSFEEDNRSELHTPTGIKPSNMEIATHGVDSKQDSNAPESSNEISGTTRSKPSFGRGRGVLPIRLPGKPSEEEEPKAEADTRNNEHDTNVGNVKIGRGITYDNMNAFPPGLAVTEEGKRFAKIHSPEAVSDDSNGNHPPSTDEETNSEVNESGNQISTRSNQGEKEEPPTGCSSSNQEEIPGFEMSHRGNMIALDRNCRDRSTEESLSDGEQTQNDEDKGTHSPEVEQRNTETDMEVDQSISDEKQCDITQQQNALASEQSLNISGRQTIQERQYHEGGDDIASGGCAGSDPAPLFKMNENPEMNSQECTTCMNHQRNPVFDYGCSHYFCKYCISAVMENIRLCPQCRQEKLFPGNQPVGYMTWRTESRRWLPGYETYGTIAVTFNFKGGIQGSDHPNPGERFSEFFCTAYLPDNLTGREVCNLLRRAFNGRLIFTIGKCPVTSEDNKIVWNGIELKTGRTGGPANCGYPDPSYLDRVKKQLADKGITSLHE